MNYFERVFIITFFSQIQRLDIKLLSKKKYIYFLNKKELTSNQYIYEEMWLTLLEEVYNIGTKTRFQKNKYKKN